MSGQAISFNGNSLQTANIITENIAHEGAAAKNATLYPLSHASASKIPFVSYPSRTITISGTIVGSSIADTDSQIDTFESYLEGIDQNLDIGYNNGTRRYIATVNSHTIDRPGGLTWANFTIQFECTQPYGQNISTTVALSASGRTSSSYNDNHTFLGTAPWQRPIWTITLTAVTGGTNAHIVVGNNATGQQITITRTWTNGDILVVDVTQKTVTVNGAAVDFTGAFPEFATGAQTLTYSDNFTTRTFTIDVEYYPMYK